MDFSSRFGLILLNLQLFVALQICIPVAKVNGLYFEGYGRDYRDRLLGQWGIVDVNDCCSCARFLVIMFYN